MEKTCKLPWLKKTSESREGDHSYTKTTRQSQKYKPSYETESSSDESVSLIDESAPCHARRNNSQRKSTQEKESIMVVRCKLEIPSLWITVRHHS